MSKEMKINAAKEAINFVEDGMKLGLGTGSTVDEFLILLSKEIKNGLNICGVPTSEKTRDLSNKLSIPLTTLESVKTLDLTIDGADEIDHDLSLIKGGGGALLRENILINAANKVVIMADDSKFVTNFDRSVPVEVHPLARNTVTKNISKIGGRPKIRTLDRGYPFITENGNIILDCNFGVIKKPKLLREKIKNISGVLEVGIFIRKPDIIYKARSAGKFDVIK